MRIVIHSNAPWVPTGYGQQVALIAPRLVAMGHEVFISSFYGLHGKPSVWNGIHVLPGGYEGYGNDIVWDHAKHVQADITIILVDAWVMAVHPAQGLHVVNMVPVDCNPLSAMDEERLKASGAMPFAISKHGMTMLRDAGFEPHYTPHGIDTKQFSPAKNLKEIRDEIKIGESTFIIGMNAANKDAVRKSFPEQILAFGEFHERHPDSVLMIHAMTQGPGALNLNDIISKSGYPGLKDAVRFTDQYSLLAGMVQPANLAAWYSVMDVLTCCSYGEGFGIPIVEAQACGTPVIVNDFSAMTELCGSGWMVKGEKFWNGAHRSWWSKPYVGDIVKAYEQAWKTRENGGMDLKSRRARKFALQYDIDLVMSEHWQPALAAVEKRLKAGVITTAAGLKWKLTDGKDQGDRLGAHHEQGTEAEMLDHIPYRGVFLDVGAHVGHYTVRAAKAGASVIAIEPNPQATARLVENLRLNNLADGRVTVHEAAAWDIEDELMLANPTEHLGSGSMMALPGDGGQRAKAVPLDQLLAEVPQLDAVKLDVNGAELQALRGLSGTLGRLKPDLFIEDHSPGSYKQEELLSLLEFLGYKPEAKKAGDYKYVVARPVTGRQPAAVTAE